MPLFLSVTHVEELQKNVQRFFKSKITVCLLHVSIAFILDKEVVLN